MLVYSCALCSLISVEEDVGVFLSIVPTLHRCCSAQFFSVLQEEEMMFEDVMLLNEPVEIVKVRDLPLACVGWLEDDM